MGKVTAWSRPKSSSSADMDSKRIGWDINMNVEISDDEEAVFHGVAVLKEVEQFLEEKRVGKLVLVVGRWTIQTEDL